MMKMRFVLPVALLVLVLVGCKSGGEAAVIGKWKSEIKVDSSQTGPGAQLLQAIGGMAMDVEFKSDHKYRMTVAAMIPIEGDWSMSGNRVTLTPKTIMGMSVEDAVKQAKQKNPSAMAMAGPSQQTQPMLLDLQSDGKTMKAVINKPEAAGTEITFTKQQ